MPPSPNAELGLKRMTEHCIAEEMMELLVTEVRREKELRKLTVRDLANLVGCSPASVSNDLSGYGNHFRLMAYLTAMGKKINLEVL